MGKFKRGNLVEFTGLYKTGERGIIEGSYNDLYGSNKMNVTDLQNDDYHDKEYSLIYPDGSGGAWTPEGHLKLIDEGGEHLITAALEVRESRKAQSRNIEWIVNNFDNIGSESILYLFERIGYVPKAFLNEGSFIHLFSDWAKIGPLFIACIKIKEENKMREILISDVDTNEKIIKLFLEIKAIQSKK